MASETHSASVTCWWRLRAVVLTVLTNGGILAMTMGGLIGISEGVCYYWIHEYPLPAPPRPIVVGTYLHPTKDRGYQLQPDSKATVTMKRGSEVLWRAAYTVDRYARRVTPVEDPENRSKFIAFFGCSFAFGEGVDDGQTLPCFVGRCAPGYVPYNYGVPGHGPTTTLYRLETEDLREEIAQQRGIGVYVFIDDHVRRTAGSMRVAWGRDQPCYEIHDGRLQWMGSFRAAHPCRTFLYDWLLKSNTLEYIHFDMPRFSEEHLTTTEQVIQAIAAAFTCQFPQSTFCVMVYPGNGSRYGERLSRALSAAGIPCFNYQSLAEHLSWKPFFEDSHPVPKTHEMTARRLAQDLQIDKKTPLAQ